LSQTQLIKIGAPTNFQFKRVEGLNTFLYQNGGVNPSDKAMGLGDHNGINI
jgi:hypothetical protein